MCLRWMLDLESLKEAALKLLLAAAPTNILFPRRNPLAIIAMASSGKLLRLKNLDPIPNATLSACRRSVRSGFDAAP